MISRLFSSLSNYGTYSTLRKAVLKIRRSPILNTYGHWIKSFEIQEIDEYVKVAACDPLHVSQIKLTVIMPVCSPEIGHSVAAIDSVLGQSHDNWQLTCVAPDTLPKETVSFLANRASGDSRIALKIGLKHAQACQASNNVLQDLSEGFVIFLDQNDMLHPRALECLAVAISLQPKVKLLYTDQDKVDANETRLDPYFKPKWSPELLLSQNYINRLACWSTGFLQKLSYLREGFEAAQDHDLLLRAASKLADSDVLHIPFPLYHARTGMETKMEGTDSPTPALDNGRKAIADYWARATDGQCQPEISVDRPLNLYHSKLELQKWPDVTLIVPHRDSPALLGSILDLWTKTDYPNLKLVLVDHSSRDSETSKMLEELAGTDRVTICEYEGAFNFSRMCNMGVKCTDPGSYICFLNNDVQLLDFNWLKNLAPYLEISGVVAVGPLLLYPDFSIQHAGIALGIGGFAGHYFKHLPYGEPSYQNWAYSTRNASALTGAALLTRRSDFDAVGGFDEEAFPTSFSDVDLCLKLSQLGRLVYCPDSKLIHLESQTRPKTDDLENIQRLRDKWGNRIDDDPYFPTIFSRLTENMTPNYRTPRPFR